MSSSPFCDVLAGAEMTTRPVMSPFGFGITKGWRGRFGKNSRKHVMVLGLWACNGVNSCGTEKGAEVARVTELWRNRGSRRGQFSCMEGSDMTATTKYQRSIPAMAPGGSQRRREGRSAPPLCYMACLLSVLTLILLSSGQAWSQERRHAIFCAEGKSTHSRAGGIISFTTAQWHIGLGPGSYKLWFRHQGTHRYSMRLLQSPDGHNFQERYNLPRSDNSGGIGPTPPFHVSPGDSLAIKLQIVGRKPQLDQLMRADPHVEVYSYNCRTSSPPRQAYCPPNQCYTTGVLGQATCRPSPGCPGQQCGSSPQCR